jgi:inorganic triphosphatase YgiF
MRKKNNKKDKSEIEQELKIALSPADLEKLFRALKKKAIGKKIEHKYMPRAYYDTPDLRLYQNSISLRMQYKPGKNGKIGGYEQTVKFDVPPADIRQTLAKGVFLRKECKDMIRFHAPVLTKVSDRQCRSAVKPFHNKKMVHIFTAAIERRAFNLRVGRGKKRGILEVAFDVGAIIIGSDRKHYPFYEVELEVKSGSPETIELLRGKIKKIARSAKVQTLSKAQQGSRLYRRAHAKNRAF